jgi:hypothetical protein
MNTLQYSICLWILETGWLTLYAICLALGTEVEFELISFVIY